METSIIAIEINWHLANRDKANQSKEWQDGFIAGMKHADYLIQVAQQVQKGKDMDAVDTQRQPTERTEA